MPDSSSYTQYNTNPQTLLTQHAMVYMAWYEAAVVVYVFAAALCIGYWFFRNRIVLGAAVTVTIAGMQPPQRAMQTSRSTQARMM